MPVRTILAAVVAATLAVTLAACSDDADTKAAVEGEGPTAAFTSPENGAALAGGVHLAMAATGVVIEPAGDVHAGAGHFHVIADGGCVGTGDAIAKDADHVHFGKGQTDGTVYLEPGSHDLCLQVGDGAHHALDVTDRVTVQVGVTTLPQWCSTIREVDDLFAATDTSSDEFAVKQIGYENIHRLVAQLSASIDLVDTAARDDVRAALAFAADLTSALVGAPDAQAAEAAVGPIYEAQPRGLPGAGWVRDACQVDIDA